MFLDEQAGSFRPSDKRAKRLQGGGPQPPLSCMIRSLPIRTAGENQRGTEKRALLHHKITRGGRGAACCPLFEFRFSRKQEAELIGLRETHVAYPSHGLEVSRCLSPSTEIVCESEGDSSNFSSATNRKWPFDLCFLLLCMPQKKMWGIVWATNKKRGPRSFAAQMPRHTRLKHSSRGIPGAWRVGHVKKSRFPSSPFGHISVQRRDAPLVRRSKKKISP